MVVLSIIRWSLPAVWVKQIPEPRPWCYYIRAQLTDLIGLFLSFNNSLPR